MQWYNRDLCNYLDVDKVNGFKKSWGSSQLTSVQHSSGCWDDLTTSTMDSISVQCDVMDVESDTTHVFFGHYTLWEIR